MQQVKVYTSYAELFTFHMTVIIFIATYWFTELFMDPFSSSVINMIHAARSARDKLAEACRLEESSPNQALRLIKLSRSVLYTLLINFEEYLNKEKRPRWPDNHVEAKAVRMVAIETKAIWPDLTDQERFTLYRDWLQSNDACIQANAIITLILQTNDQLSKRISELETTAHPTSTPDSQREKKHSKANIKKVTSLERQKCPKCGMKMIPRLAKSTYKNSQTLLFCTGYPACAFIKIV